MAKKKSGVLTPSALQDLEEKYLKDNASDIIELIESTWFESLKNNLVCSEHAVLRLLKAKYKPFFKYFFVEYFEDRGWNCTIDCIDNDEFVVIVLVPLSEDSENPL